MIPAFHHWVMTTIGTQNSWLIQFALTTAVLVGPGQVFFTHGIPALRRRAPDMNSLVAMGASAAWGYSTLATFAPALLPATQRAVYFEAAAVIVTLILLGRLLEARAGHRLAGGFEARVGQQRRCLRAWVGGAAHGGRATRRESDQERQPDTAHEAGIAPLARARRRG